MVLAGGAGGVACLLFCSMYILEPASVFLKFLKLFPSHKKAVMNQMNKVAGMANESIIVRTSSPKCINMEMI